MKDDDIAAYLTAAAWADGPISDTEQDLVGNLLFSLGLEREQARELLESWEFKAPSPPDLASLTDRQQAIALLRALLVLSYSDGHFGLEELPYLTKVLDKFKVSTEELVQLRLQAHYYLDPEAEAIPIPEDLIEAGRWEEIEALAKATKDELRRACERKIREELHTASEDSLLLMLYRGRSFDVAEARTEFEKRRAALVERHGDVSDTELLQSQLVVMTLAKWERLYAERCASCELGAPGRKATLCPRCNEDYL